ncbi:MAG: cobyric acid synthase CobQ, partial [Alphaproteobacteria bacterium]|nr:cobyric acid synthase CobQ [Alphaproteobacteria bacterium]
RRGGKILGICGGYQMLGKTIADPQGIEGTVGQADGLGLLDIDTVLGAEKSLGERTAIHRESGQELQGYDIHLGRSEGAGRARPFLTIDGAGDGARSADGRVEGCYLHGLFRANGFRHAYLAGLRQGTGSGIDFAALVENTLDGLAAHLESHLDLDRMLEIAHAP